MGWCHEWTLRTWRSDEAGRAGDLEVWIVYDDWIVGIRKQGEAWGSYVALIEVE